MDPDRQIERDPSHQTASDRSFKYYPQANVKGFKFEYHKGILLRVEIPCSVAMRDGHFRQTGMFEPSALVALIGIPPDHACQGLSLTFFEVEEVSLEGKTASLSLKFACKDVEVIRLLARHTTGPSIGKFAMSSSARRSCLPVSHPRCMYSSTRSPRLFHSAIILVAQAVLSTPILVR